MKKFNTYGTFGCINQISHTDKNSKVTIENVSALKILEHRNKKALVLTDEQKEKLQGQEQVSRMKREHEESIKGQEEYNSGPIEKRYEYVNTYGVGHKKEFGYIPKQAETSLKEMLKKVELEKKFSKIKTHVFEIEKGNQKTNEQINSEVQAEIKEAEYKLDCEKKRVEYHTIENV